MVRSRSAFSLVELVIVIVVIGVIAAIAVPRVSTALERSSVAQVQQTVQAIQTKIEIETGLDRSSPAGISSQWFPGGTLQHALFPNESATITVVNTPGITNPAQISKSGGLDHYWYNAATGAFRARVPSQKTVAATNLFYAKVNGLKSFSPQVAQVDGPSQVTGQVTAQVDGP